MPLNVLHIGKYGPPFYGGIENFMMALMRQQATQGIHPSALVHHHQRHRKATTYQKEGILISAVPIVGVALYVPIAPIFGVKLNQHLKVKDADILHMHMPNLSCFWALFLPAARTKKWVVHWHSDVIGAAADWRVKMLYPVYRLFEKALLNKADKIIVTSPAYLQTSQALEKFTHKCEVVPLGLPRRADDSGIAVTKVNNTLPVFNLLCVGRLTYYKGHAYLLEAIALLKKKHIACHLTIVGSGDCADTLKQQSKDLAISEQITFEAGLDDQQLLKRLAHCDALVLPSIERTEAFGVVLLEAMRFARPCIVTDVKGSGMNWVVEDDRTGWVVKAADAGALADKIEQLASGPHQCLLDAGLASFNRFNKLFTIEKVERQIASVYDNVLSLSST